MCRTLETLFLALSFAFVGWLIIVAGVKFEVKIGDGVYGFQIKGDADRVKDAIIGSYNCSERIPELMISFNEVEFEYLNCNHLEGIQSYLANVYPQYQNGHIEQRDGFYFITLFDRISIRRDNLKYYYNPQLALNNKTIYSVVFNPFSLKTAFGHD